MQLDMSQAIQEVSVREATAEHLHAVEMTELLLSQLRGGAALAASAAHRALRSDGSGFCCDMLVSACTNKGSSGNISIHSSSCLCDVVSSRNNLHMRTKAGANSIRRTDLRCYAHSSSSNYSSEIYGVSSSSSSGFLTLHGGGVTSEYATQHGNTFLSKRMNSSAARTTTSSTQHLAPLAGSRRKSIKERRRSSVSSPFQRALKVSDVRVRNPLQISSCLNSAASCGGAARRQQHRSRLLLLFQKLRREYFPRGAAADAEAKKQHKQAVQHQRIRRQQWLLQQQQQQQIPFHEKTPPLVCAAAALVLHQHQLQEATGTPLLRLPGNGAAEATVPSSVTAALPQYTPTTSIAAPAAAGTAAIDKITTATASDTGVQARLPSREEKGRGEEGGEGPITATLRDLAAPVVVVAGKRDEEKTGGSVEARRYAAAPAVTAASLGTETAIAGAILQQKKNALHKRLWKMLRTRSKHNALAFRTALQELDCRLPSSVVHVRRGGGEVEAVGGLLLQVLKVLESVSRTHRAAFWCLQVWDILSVMKAAKVHPSLVRFNYRVIFSYIELRHLNAEPRRENVLRLLRAAWLLAALIRNRRQRHVLRKNAVLRQLGMQEHQLLSLHDLEALWVGTAADPLLPRPAQAVLLQERFSSPMNISASSSTGLWRSLSVPYSSLAPSSCDAEIAALAAAAADPRAAALPQAYSAAAAAVAEDLGQHPLFVASPEAGKGLIAEFSRPNSSSPYEWDSEAALRARGPPLEALLFDDRLTSTGGGETGTPGGRDGEQKKTQVGQRKVALAAANGSATGAGTWAAAGEAPAEAEHRETPLWHRPVHEVQGCRDNGWNSVVLKDTYENEDPEERAGAETGASGGGNFFHAEEKHDNKQQAGRRESCDAPLYIGRRLRRHGREVTRRHTYFFKTPDVSASTKPCSLATTLARLGKDGTVLSEGDMMKQRKGALYAGMSIKANEGEKEGARNHRSAAAACEKACSVGGVEQDVDSRLFYCSGSQREEPSTRRHSSNAFFSGGQNTGIAGTRVDRTPLIQIPSCAGQAEDNREDFTEHGCCLVRERGTKVSYSDTRGGQESGATRALQGRGSQQHIWRMLHRKIGGEVVAQGRHSDGVTLASKYAAQVGEAKLTPAAPSGPTTTVQAPVLQGDAAEDTVRAPPVRTCERRPATTPLAASPAATDTLATTGKEGFRSLLEKEWNTRIMEGVMSVPQSRAVAEETGHRILSHEGVGKMDHNKTLQDIHRVETRLFFKKGRARVQNWRKLG